METFLQPTTERETTATTGAATILILSIKSAGSSSSAAVVAAGGEAKVDDLFAQRRFPCFFFSCFDFIVEIMSVFHVSSADFPPPDAVELPLLSYLLHEFASILR